MEKFFIDYGKLIKEHRKLHNMTQSQLAEKLELRKSSISNYETGYSTPSALMLEKIAMVFNLSFTEFIALNENNTLDSNVEVPRYNQDTDEVFIPYVKFTNTYDENNTSSNGGMILPEFMIEKNTEYICTKVPDDSMENEHIKTNDYIIVKKTHSPSSRDIVFVIHKPSKQYIIRRYIKEEHSITLLPASMSSDYNIIRADDRDNSVEIIGTVERVVSSVK